MKRLFLLIILLVLFWALFIQSSRRTDEWVVFWEDRKTGEIHKCKREDYLELKQMMPEYERKYRQRINKSIEDIKAYNRWEFIEKLKKYKN